MPFPKATFLNEKIADPFSRSHLPGPEADPPVETDSRLHSDGKGWKLNQAIIVDRERPRVLLIGDSILGGSMKAVIRELDGKAYVDT